MHGIDDVQQQLQQSIEELQNQLSHQFEQLAVQKEAQQRSHDQLSELIIGLSVQMLQFTNRFAEVGSNGGAGFSNGGNNFSRLSRIDFPRFDGEDVQGWLYRCEQFFELDAMPENRKVKVASIHLNGRALVWLQFYMKGFGVGNWPEWDEYLDYHCW